MEAFDPNLCRTERDVESKLLVHYLLPQLGYGVDSWYEEVALGSIRLDFLVLATSLLAGRLAPPAAVVMEAKRPQSNLDPHVPKLRRYLTALGIRYGLLTNAWEIRVYETQSPQAIAEVFRCGGQHLHTHLEDLRQLIGKSSPNLGLPIPVVPSPRRIPMKTIAVYHNKGGVGKTTTVTNLGAALARQGFRVLLIDLDSQANTTFATGLMKFADEEDDILANNNVYHAIAEKFQFQIAEVARRASYCAAPVDVMPAHINLIQQERILQDKSFAKTRLLEKLNKAKDSYDFVIIDCPPSLNLYAQVALTMTDYLIIPSDLKPFANEGLRNVRNFIDENDEFRGVIQRPPISVLGVLPSKIMTNAKFVENTLPRVEEKVRSKYGFPMLESRIFDRVDLGKCLNVENNEGEVPVPDPQSIFDFAPDSAAAKEFGALAAEILQKVGAMP
ncbi:MAG TPA: chromosome partitioning protein ParA [Cyanobacteria bacterium UBA8156]|nr:chromosome partitioning protein ParA [Cyanobacteria bacterium UBA8156]